MAYAGLTTAVATDPPFDIGYRHKGFTDRMDDDALCNLDSPGPGMWAKLADPIEGKN